MVVNGTSPCRVFAHSPAPGREGPEGKSSSQAAVLHMAAGAGEAELGAALGAGRWVPPANRLLLVPLLAWAPSALPPSSPLAELLQWG